MTEEVRFAAKDKPLSADVRKLGALLGQLLREQGGEELYQRVERARSAARRRRRQRAGAGDDRLDSLLAGLEPAAALATVRAFSVWFELVNTAERIHRLRRRRSYQNRGEPQPAGPEAVFRDLVARGVTAAEIGAAAARIVIEPVFTAHPTEATRTAILAHEQRVAELLLERSNRGPATPLEEERSFAAIHETVTVSWQTDENRAQKPTIADELEHVLFHIDTVLYEIVPDLDDEIRRALEAVGLPGWTRTEPLLRFASWVGGDMDGNPSVGADTIRLAIGRHRELIVQRYRREVLALARRLTQSRSRIAISTALEERLERYRALFPEAAAAIAPSRQGMPYHVFLVLVAERLGRSMQPGDDAGYGLAGEFGADLELARRSLVDHLGARAGARSLTRLQLRLATFGFHLAALDLRQDALVHRRVAGELLGVKDFEGLEARERTRLIESAASGKTAIPTTSSPETTSTLAVMQAIAALRLSHGSEAIGPHVISMARGPDDALALLFIARAAGLVDDQGAVPLDIAPLFETVADLEVAAATMESLLGHPEYRRHLEHRAGRQVVMLGYSDSNKGAGIAASRWALQCAQAELAAVAERQEIELVLFHGRGGTVSRGGGKPREAILAQPRRALGGSLRFTEQGEIIRAKYGLEAIALRTLEVVAGALVEAGCRAEAEPGAEARALMDLVAGEGRLAYRKLVEDPAFFTFFRAATPIDVIEKLRIGSRPSSRRAQKGIEDLRAIPWVFAWTQSRHTLPGWYGIGSGLEAAVAAFGVEELRRQAREWNFFGNLLGDVEMVLAKGDFDMAERYAELAGDAGREIQDRIRSEYQRTIAMLLLVGEQDELLQGDPALQRAIRLRNPYIDPMSFIQLDLLKRWRAGGRVDPELERALVSSVKGIARGLLNTG